MRKLLTVGEFSFLTTVSSYTIRYYEKEGLIKPAKVDSNGYHLYDYNNVEVLGNIVLLKQLGLTLKEIKVLMEDINVDKYKEVMEDSLTSLTDEISKLEKYKSEIISQLNYLNDKDIEEFDLMHCEERKLSKITTLSYDDYSMKEVYNALRKLDINMEEVNELEDIYLLDEHSMIYCKQFKHADCEEIVLKEGKYLSYKFITNDFDFTKGIERFYEELYVKGLQTDSELISIMDALPLFDSNGMYFVELQVKVKTND